MLKPWRVFLGRAKGKVAPCARNLGEDALRAERNCRDGRGEAVLAGQYCDDTFGKTHCGFHVERVNAARVAKALEKGRH